MAPVKGLRERLADGESLVVAEGYILELERRGYLSLGAFAPLVVLDKPDVVRMLHEEWVHAGSDVVEACTYFGHKSQLELVGRGADHERLNRAALRMARDVADENGALMAGNVCNTLVYTPGDQAGNDAIRDMFKEQVRWAVEERADLIIAETFFDLGEARLALDAVLQHGQGLPVVVTLAAPPDGRTFDGVPVPEACRRLEEAGADVVGLNCERGPATMLPLIREVRAACKGPIACLPVPLHTDEKHVVMHQLRDPVTKLAPVCPDQLDAFLCNRQQVREFAQQARDLGVQYIGLCCFNCARYIREVADVYGKSPPANKYLPKSGEHLTAQDDPARRYQLENYTNKLCYVPPE